MCGHGWAWWAFWICGQHWFFLQYPSVVSQTVHMLDAGKERIDPNFSIRFVSIRALQLDSSSDISSPTWESQSSQSALIVVVFLGLHNHRSSSLNMKKQWTASELGFQQHLHPHLQCSLMDQWFDLWEKQWIICRTLYIYYIYIYTYYLQVNFQMNCEKIDMIRQYSTFHADLL
jgi:hypothetical protein